MNEARRAGRIQEYVEQPGQRALAIGFRVLQWRMSLQFRVLFKGSFEQRSGVMFDLVLLGDIDECQLAL